MPLRKVHELTFLRFGLPGPLLIQLKQTSDATSILRLCGVVALLPGGVRVRFRVRFPAVKVPIFGGFPVENPTNKATAPELF